VDNSEWQVSFAQGMNSQGKTPALTFPGSMVVLATLAAGLTFGGNYIYEYGYDIWLEH
jgi:hypothetical protein